MKNSTITMLALVLMILSTYNYKADYVRAATLPAATIPTISIYVPVTALAQCAWPVQYAQGTLAWAECRINLNGIPRVAYAVNGGKFVLQSQ